MWTFSEHPDAELCYGARLVDDFGRHHHGTLGGGPWLQFLPWDRVAVEEFNRIDINVLAHRREHAGARFGEQFDYFADWDMLLKLTDTADPIEVPVVATYYTTDAPRRLSHADAGERQRHYERIRAETACRRRGVS